jgi:hypothetical protein
MTARAVSRLTAAADGAALFRIGGIFRINADNFTQIRSSTI